MRHVAEQKIVALERREGRGRQDGGRKSPDSDIHKWACFFSRPLLIPAYESAASASGRLS